MDIVNNSRVLRIFPLLIAVSLVSFPAQAQYSGGSGTAEDPYNIATAEDLMLLGETPGDYDKHFILTVDIDLDPNLAGRKAFYKAIIASDRNDAGSDFQGAAFTGFFDGNGHTISHLMIAGEEYLGLFGRLEARAEVRNLGVVDVSIAGRGNCVGGLAGHNGGIMRQCYSTGQVSGNTEVGGLTGQNSGSLANCHSSSAVSGSGKVGGLAGQNFSGHVVQCYSTGKVEASGWYAGGLLGSNSGYVFRCYSTGPVKGRYYAGGLAADNSGFIINCYSAGLISGIGPAFGGLVGRNTGTVVGCFWDVQASGRKWSDAGMGQSTAQMQGIRTYVDAGWDWAGEASDGISEVWQMSEEGGYPVLAVFDGYDQAELQGLGTAEHPYLISDAFELAAVVNYSPFGHYRLAASIDLSGIRWGTALIPWFAGTFDGNGLTISNLTIAGTSYLGLFGQVESGAEVKNLGLVDVNIAGSGSDVGGLIGDNYGFLSRCYSKGMVGGNESVGGLVGENSGSVTHCYSAGGTIFGSGPKVGGLIGSNKGDVSLCYSSSLVTVDASGGGLIGSNRGSVVGCLWDIEASGQTRSSGGIGLTTSQMMNPDMYGLNGDWALEPSWILDPGNDYPRLAWEGTPGQPIPEPTVYWLAGTGAEDDPYVIVNADQMILLGQATDLWDKHFKLMADIDMAAFSYSMAPIAPDVDSDNGGFQGIPFTGLFDGNGHTISHLTIMGGSYLGLFGRLAPGAQVRNLGIVDVGINLATGPGYNVGALAGENSGLVSHCYSSGLVGASGTVGGLVGKNTGSVTYCYSTGGTVLTSGASVGGLVGFNEGTVRLCYSANTVIGDTSAGGLVGSNDGSVASCVWDIDASGQTRSAGGIGLTATQMVNPDMYSLNGDWAMDPSWVLDVGNDYPRLAWESTPGQPIPEPTVDWLTGAGTVDNPYTIMSADQLIMIGQARALWNMHFRLDADISLEGTIFPEALIREFAGTFNGNNHTISGLRITGDRYLGLFGQLLSGAEVHDLGIVSADVSGNGGDVGILAGQSDGVVVGCYATGVVEGDDRTGGLIGMNRGSLTRCYSTSRALGDDNVGGLAGSNNGTLANSYSTGAVTGRDDNVGGLVGYNSGTVISCYSTGSASGDDRIGGLVGSNEGNMLNCYSAGIVSGDRIGGLVGSNGGSVTDCLWDAEVSGQVVTSAGVGLTTAQMMDPLIYGLNGWAMKPDWVLDAGNDYPRLAWQGTTGQPIPEPTMDWLAGMGTPDDPYRIDNAGQLVLIGKARVLWGECFKLIVDIDMAGIDNFGPVIPEFAGVFDGNSHTISGLKITGNGYLGLFGQILSGAEVHDLGVVNADISQSGANVGILAGQNNGVVIGCYATGVVEGDDRTGGLVGSNEGSLTTCYSASRVLGDDYVGGLAGSNNGTLAYSYSTGAVSGRDDNVGGLAGLNSGNVTSCYSTGSASGDDRIGGLVGSNDGNVVNCYSTTVVSGDHVGGLAASNSGEISNCFWNVETSGQTRSGGGIGLTTTEMMDSEVYGLNRWALNADWILDIGNDYPHLAWEGRPGQPIPEPKMDWISGIGTRQNPYQVVNADQLYLIGKASILWDKAIELKEDINLSGMTWSTAVIPVFSGSFNGNGHVIRNLKITDGQSLIGLFGRMTSDAEVRDLGLVDVDVTSTASQIGALVGENGGVITHCYSTGAISGNDWIGGLVGSNNGNLSNCYSTSRVQGDDNVGGLAGSNNGTLVYSYSTGAVSGRDDNVGGLAGSNSGNVTSCYSTGSASGDDRIGGLIGSNEGDLSNCYSTTVVSGDHVGGLAASNSGEISNCFWNVETSGQTRSAGGIGLTTTEMMDSEVYGLNRWALNADWILDIGNDYPHLAWEGRPGQPIPEPKMDWIGGTGTSENPYQVVNADQLYLIGKASILWDKAIELKEDINLSGMTWSTAVIPVFSGSFSGNGHVIRNLQISNGETYVGLFGRISPEADIYDLGVEDANVSGADNIGILAGRNEGIVTNCFGAGVVAGGGSAGGLVGFNRGSLSNCRSTGAASGRYSVGGLVGFNEGSVTYCSSTTEITGNGDNHAGLVGFNSGDLSCCCSTGSASGADRIGGLIGSNEGRVINCYSSGAASGDYAIGGLVGSNMGDVTRCYSTGIVSGGYIGGLVATSTGSITYGLWDVETSDQDQSEGGVGLITSEMMDPEMCGLNGWAEDPNWVLDAGTDYPRLAWEGLPGQLIPEPIIDWLAGTGTKEHPYQLTDIDQFALIARASILWDDCMELTQDIDLAGTAWPTAVIPAFSGTFLGRGHAIRNLKISGRNNLGLFGEIRNEAQIVDISILDADVNGIAENIGALAGKNMGLVIGCDSTGIVSGDGSVGSLIGDSSGRVVDCSSAGSVTGNWTVGGLLGSNRGHVMNSHSACTISGDYIVGGLLGNNTGSMANCRSTGSVSGNRIVGGLVGQNNVQALRGWGWGWGWGWGGSPVGNSTGILLNCSSSSTVSGGNTVGGFVGSNNTGRVANCYSTGPVLGDRCVGGFAGENSGNVANCYSVGMISSNGDGLASGLVGQNFVVTSGGGLHGWSFTVNGTVTDSFWDMGASETVESDGGYGLTTVQMQNIQTFVDAGWDFLGLIENGLHETWQMPDEGGYPVLSAFNGYEPPSLPGEGTPENPYLISTAGELGAILHNDIKAHYKLATDLDLSGIAWSMAVIPTFDGHFDGHGFAIRGLTIPRGDNIGLFGQIAAEAEIYDLGIVNANIAGGTHVGALAGLNDHGFVHNCYSTGSISGSVSTGGLIGYSNGGIVADCHSTATVLGGLNSGGLLGYILDGDVIGCNSTGSVSGQDYVGGLVGDNSGNLSNCYSNSDTSGNNEVGGLVGVNSRSISRSYSTGTVSGNDLVGGLAGRSSGSNLDNCYSSSSVSGNSNIGGLVGQNDSVVANCYSTGAVSGNMNVGGLIGLNSSQVTDCFWDVETSDLSVSSAGDGLPTAAMQNILIYLDSGWDFVGTTENGTEDIWFIDGLDYPRLSWEYEQ